MNNTDVVLNEIIRNRFVSIADEMATTLVRTAYNPLLYEVQDFSITVMSPTGDMWSEMPGVMVFSQAFPHAVRQGIKRWGDNLSDGDVLIVNDPFETGTHISDTNVYMPVFHEGELVAFCGSAAHWADVGGKIPGGWCPDTTDTYQEGLCFRHQKLIERGVINEALWDLIDCNVRVPTIVRGDLEAQVAACRQGSIRIRELCEKYGREVVDRAMSAVIEQTHTAMSKAISALPNGTHSASIRMDFDGINRDGDFLVCLKTTIQDDSIRFSLDGTSPVAMGPINLPAPCTKGILASSIKGILMPLDPCNAGHAMCIEYDDLPKDSLVNPSWPAPTDSYGYIVGCLMELTFRCLADVVPDKIPAGCYMLTGAFLGKESDDENESTVVSDALHGGNGALFNDDGVTNQLVGNGDLPNNPVEVLETRHPIRVESLEFATDMAGHGAHRGGFGVRKKVTMLADDFSLNFVIENTKDTSAAGVQGGGDGKPGNLTINPDSNNPIVYRERQGALGPYPKNTVYEVVTGGGGGWGNPYERDTHAVLKDVSNDFLTVEQAAETYGVSLIKKAGTWAIDAQATSLLRAK
ncbi:MAG: hydantoinase B/oxoprolinase family protein [Pseudomonadota bacterium]